MARVTTLCKWKNLRYPLLKALQKAQTNSPELITAIETAPDENSRKAVIFLVAFMPERDLLTLTAGFILDNVAWAMRARTEFPWAKTLPEKVFFNDVLPYALLNERRDAWRQSFYETFAPLLTDCKTLDEAISIVNKSAIKELKVNYSTKRKKADQSPFESMESGIASCSGLSILLSDAFRSVGIPSRIAGVPKWTTKPGNHSWCEVWTSDGWAFTEYHVDKKGLNHGWLLADAAKADDTRWDYRVYASSFVPQPYWFPLVWDVNIRFVHACDVSKRYKTLWNSRHPAAVEGLQRVAILLYDANGERVSRKVTVLDAADKRLGDGVTRQETDDLNNMLEFKLKPNAMVTIQYPDADGETTSKTITVKKQKAIQKIKLHWEKNQ